MSSAPNEDFSDIYDLELKLREKLAQLQFNEENLQQCQAQLTESQNSLCQLKILLDNERRILNQTRSELDSASELISQLEDEKISSQTQLAQLQLNWKNAQIIHDNLINQAKKTKLENIIIQRKNEILEAKLSEQKMLNEIISENVKDLRCQINKLYPVIQSNVEKLKEEQKCLCDAFQVILKK
ncbi:hypothetical protein PV328_003067 [Microctonus aethiopoides]|uniref:Uncharacterized protein n=1 Tax=Microctonus aethiopoides TaxID=144406 RepID=A0AA39F7M3_9HYME|nr:hypothetical protein PV328_003067 [Microctonus aethiopoides]